MSLKLALFASGGGTNALNLLSVSKNLKNIEIVLVIVDQIASPLPGIIADQFPGVKAELVTAPNLKDSKLRRQMHEKAILALLRESKVDWIFLAGYMRIMGETLLDEYSTPGNPRIVNIHPSLLPAYPGLHAYERAFEAGDLVSGVTIHFVDSGMDTGPIIVQEPFERKPGDTLVQFSERGKALEWKLYGEVLKKLSENQTLVPKISRNS